ncbi:MAG: hypothetical protein EBU59_13280, partial [Planctomycetia bacterium]|nr:hypothetical protein [Planctomycetia bacterium]
ETRRDARQRRVATTASRQVQARRGRSLQLETLEPRAMLNAAPVNTVPTGVQQAIIDQPFAFTAYRGNQISIADPDAGANPVEVTLSVNQGALTLINNNPGGGLTYSINDGGQNVNTMTFTGEISVINTALSWVSYVSSAVGTATLTITTNDQGHVGDGGPQSDTDTIQINVGTEAGFTDSPAHATYPSVLDTAINGSGIASDPYPTAVLDSVIYDIHVLKNAGADTGKILAVGAVNNELFLLRFNADLTADQTFGKFGGSTIEDAAEEPLAIGDHGRKLLVDPLGRIIVVGGNKLARFLPGGQLDTEFGDNGYQSIWAGSTADWERYREVIPTDVAIQPDGRILVSFKKEYRANYLNETDRLSNGQSWFHIARFSPAGQPDGDVWNLDAGDYRTDPGPSGNYYGDAAAGLIVQQNGDVLITGRYWDRNS